MHDWHYGAFSRKLHEKGLCSYIPVTYHQGPRIIRKTHCVDVAVVVAHYGNWEWSNFIPTIIKHKMITVYKPLQNKHFDKFMNDIRLRYGVIMTPMSNVIRDVISYRKQNIPILVTFISDQTPAITDIRYWTTFLNQDTPVFTGAEKIAAKYDMAVVFFNIEKIKRGYYNLDIQLLFEHSAGLPEHHITDTHVKHLEKIIFSGILRFCNKIYQIGKQRC